MNETKKKLTALSCLYTVKTGIGYVKVLNRETDELLYSGKQSTKVAAQADEAYALLIGNADPEEIIAKHANDVLDTIPEVASSAAADETEDDDEPELSELAEANTVFEN